MRTVLLLLVLSTSTALAPALAQAPPAKNPRAGDPNAIRAGLARFQLSCAECHGIDAKGVFGPDLTTLWAAGVSEERIFDIVRRGIQGSSMPASRVPDDEIWAVLAYLRTLAPSVPLPPPATRSTVSSCSGRGVGAAIGWAVEAAISCRTCRGLDRAARVRR